MKEGWQVSFNQRDEVAVESAEDDLIIISADIGNNTVRRILIDDGSAVEIMSNDIYQKMGLEDRDLRHAKNIYDFGNNFIHVRGGITAGDYGTRSSHPHFLRQLRGSRSTYGYNTIFGRPMMNAMQMVTAVYYLTIKFLTPIGIGFVREDLRKVRECQVRPIELTQKAPSLPAVMEIRGTGTSQIPLDKFDHREKFLKPEPIGKTTPVQLCGETSRKLPRWGANCRKKTKLDSLSSSGKIVTSSHGQRWTCQEFHTM